MKPIPKKFLLHPLYSPALGFGCGYVPKLPGTAGTVLGIVPYLMIQSLPVLYYLLLVLLLFGLGIWLCGATAKALEVHDHPGIVWDEIVGFLVTMFMAPGGWRWILLGFLLFRLFDIWKPWPIRLLDRRVEGGLGIMADDLLAGIFACLMVQIIAYLL